jgi:hypothetical protein
MIFPSEEASHTDSLVRTINTMVDGWVQKSEAHKLLRQKMKHLTQRSQEGIGIAMDSHYAISAAAFRDVAAGLSPQILSPSLLESVGSYKVPFGGQRSTFRSLQLVPKNHLLSEQSGVGV